MKASIRSLAGGLGTSLGKPIESALKSLQSTSAISPDERENRIENATQILEVHGIDLRDAVTDTDLIDQLVTGILTLNLKLQISSAPNESDLLEIDLSTEDVELMEKYEKHRSEFAAKLAPYKPIEVLARFGYSGYWENLDRTARVIRSEYLLEYASQNNIHASPIWDTVYGTNGIKVSLHEKELDN